MKAEFRPGQVLYTRILADEPRNHKKFVSPPNGDFIVMVLGHLKPNSPPIGRKEIVEIQSAIGLVSFGDVFEALGQKELDILIDFIKDKYGRLT